MHDEVETVFKRSLYPGTGKRVVADGENFLSARGHRNALALASPDELAPLLHDLAHELCDGRWLATGGGGYALVQVVPRTWTHLLAEAAGRPVDPAAQTPGAWREYVERRTGRKAPEQMTDGEPGKYVPFESGFDPGDPVDQAIIATQRAVFPLHGMMPLL